MFADEGHSGATLARPGLEALRDLAAQGCLDVVLVYSPDRLARKFAYQALLIEELARCGARVEFVKGPRGDSPEDQLLVQFQGMFAEYEKAQLMERYRRGKAWRAKSGSVNVLSGAPFGYRYVRKTPESGARYEVVPHEAVLVAEMFRRYADDGAAIADLRRWLTAEGVRTRTGKERWDRSVIWGMLRNPAYAGTAVFGKTQAVHEPAGLNRTARLAGRHGPRGRSGCRTGRRRNGRTSPFPPWWTRRRSTGSSSGWRTTSGSPRGTRRSRPCCRAWPPARPAATATTAPPPPLPPGRRSTTTGASAPTTTATRAAGSARTSPSAPTTPTGSSWTTSPPCSPTRPLSAPRSARGWRGPAPPNPVTRKRGQLGQALAKTTASIAAMITAFSEQLLTIDELRARMPDLRARQTGLKDQIAALDAHAADRDAYLKLAGDLEGFLARLRRAPPPPPPRTASGSCAPSSRTSSSDPRKSPSATASPSGNQPAAAATTTPPTRRVICAIVRCCVGGVLSPILSNIMLDDLDRSYRTRGHRFVRYADDLRVFVRSERAATGCSRASAA